MRERTILSKFTFQIVQTTWKGLMVGVAAYLGALVSIEIQQATTKPENTFDAFVTSVSGTLPLVLLIALLGGFFIFLLAASFEIHRTPRAVKVNAMVHAVNGARRRAGLSRAGRVGPGSAVIRWWDSATSGFCLAFTAFLNAPLLLLTILFGFDLMA